MQSLRIAAVTLAFALLTAPTPVAAQAPPCASEAHRAFDFCVGRWEVRTPDGRIVGHNTIQRLMNGCVLHEHYTTASGYERESVNIYDASRGVWHQSWVDNGGLLLLPEGGVQESRMVMEGGQSWTTAFDGLYFRGAPPAQWDILLTGGMVIDGSGGPAYRADVAIIGDRISEVSTVPLDPAGATRVLDVRGLVVSLGFVDIHAHLGPILRLPGAESHVRQGVTTALGGPDGGGPWPFAEHLESIEELARMEGMIAQAMAAGAWGISTGLKYLPGAFSDLDEIVALSTVAADYGGIYTSHPREEGLGLFESVTEAMEIGRRASIPVVLTHHKVVGAPMWGASSRTLAMVDSARAAGTDVMMDQYPYTAGYTGITVIVPAWALAGGTDSLLARMDDPTLADSILAGIEFNIINDRGANDIGRIQFATVTWDRTLEGLTFGDFAHREGVDPTPANGARLVIEVVRRGGANAIFHAMDEHDVEAIMAHPFTAIASDGRLTEPGVGHPHPRWYGTFPRVLGRYVRERGVLTLEDAVRKMTSLPASRMGLFERGEIRQGWYADLVVFDPETVIDRATFTEPHQYPLGIPWVMVNGEVAVENGEFRDVRSGRVLRKTAGG